MFKTYDTGQAAFIDRDVKIYDSGTAAWKSANSAKTYDTSEGAWVERLGQYFELEVANFNCGGSIYGIDNSIYINIVSQSNGMNDNYWLEWEGEGIDNPVLKCTYTQGGTNASKTPKVNPSISFMYNGSVVLERTLYPTSKTGTFTEDIQINVTGTVDKIVIQNDCFTQTDDTFYVHIENLTINDKPYRYKE